MTNLQYSFDYKLIKPNRVAKIKQVIMVIKVNIVLIIKELFTENSEFGIKYLCNHKVHR